MIGRIALWERVVCSRGGCLEPDHDARNCAVWHSMCAIRHSINAPSFSSPHRVGERSIASTETYRHVVTRTSPLQSSEEMGIHESPAT